MSAARGRRRAFGVPRYLFAATLIIAVSAMQALAVSPLVTDDADTVERGHLQLNVGWQLSRTASVRSHALPVNLVVGLTSRGELGATFGYQWRDGLGGDDDSDDVTDLMLGTKWWLWQQSDDGFKLSARLDLKVPTASEHRGFGTGNVDAGAALIGMRCWASTCLDWNVGYGVIDVSRVDFGDDRWLIGQAVRHDFSPRWTLIGEIFALLPHGEDGNRANVQFNGGAQLAIVEHLRLSALIGTSVGRYSPDLTAYAGFTWEM